MTRLVEDATFVRALHEIAREQGLTLSTRHDYGTDAVILFRYASSDSRDTRIAAILPLDGRLIEELSHPRTSRVAFKRCLREDLFSDIRDRDDFRPGDGVRDLRRLGLVGCHVLAEQLGDAASDAGIQVLLSPQHPSVIITATKNPRIRLTLAREVVTLFKQFHRGERYAGAYRAYMRQLETAR